MHKTPAILAVALLPLLLGSARGGEDDQWKVETKEPYFIDGPIRVEFIRTGSRIPRARFAVVGSIDHRGLPDGLSLVDPKGRLMHLDPHWGTADVMHHRAVLHIALPRKARLTVSVDLANACKITKPGSYTLRIGDDKLAVLQFHELEILQTKTHMPEFIFPPAEPAGESKIRSRGIAYTQKIEIRIGRIKGHDTAVLCIGGYDPLPPAAKDPALLLADSLLRGNSSFEYCRVPADVRIAEVLSDYRGLVWVRLAKRSGEERLIVWNAITKEEFWPYPWLAGAISLDQSHINKAQEWRFVLASAEGSDLKLNTHFPFRKHKQETAIEAEVQKRLAAELKKRGIETKKHNAKEDKKE